MTENKLILGLDYNNLIFSNYYSKDLINSKGINVNAIKGFFFRLNALREFFQPDYIVIATDISRLKTFRRKLYSQYKANRTSPPPDDLRTQMGYGLELLRSMGFPIINSEEYEADDILGMISKYATDNDMSMVITSSDRDYYQLINDNVSIFNPRKGIVIDKEWIQKEYKLDPHQLIDVKALAGDSGDNIPGATGIGERTALTLMQKYGSLEQIRFFRAVLSPKLQSILDTSKDNIDLSKILGTIITDYNKIGLTMSMIEPQPSIDTNNALALLNYLEIPSIRSIIYQNILQPV